MAALVEREHPAPTSQRLQERAIGEGVEAGGVQENELNRRAWRSEVEHVGGSGTAARKGELKTSGARGLAAFSAGRSAVR
jgi:hypothetical protein